jgi:hypothetical protein
VARACRSQPPVPLIYARPSADSAPRLLLLPPARAHKRKTNDHGHHSTRAAARPRRGRRAPAGGRAGGRGGQGGQQEGEDEEHLQGHRLPRRVHQDGREAREALPHRGRAERAGDAGGSLLQARGGGAHPRGDEGAQGLSRRAEGAGPVQPVLPRRRGQPRRLPPRHPPPGRRNHPRHHGHGGAGHAELRRAVQAGRREEEPLGAVEPVAQQDVRGLPLALQHDLRASFPLQDTQPSSARLRLHVPVRARSRDIDVRCLNKKNYLTGREHTLI